MPTILGKAIASCHRRTGYNLALQNSPDSGYLRLRIVIGYHVQTVLVIVWSSPNVCGSLIEIVNQETLMPLPIRGKYPHAAFRPSSEDNINFYTSPQSYLGPSITTVTLPINIETLKGSPFNFQRLHNIPEVRTRIWTSGLYTSILYLY